MRQLSRTEIRDLENRGCTAENWAGIRVTDPFQPDRLRNVRFYGDNSLGIFEKTITFPGGLPLPTGLYNARLVMRY